MYTIPFGFALTRKIYRTICVIAMITCFLPIFFSNELRILAFVMSLITFIVGGILNLKSELIPYRKIDNVDNNKIGYKTDNQYKRTSRVEKPKNIKGFTGKEITGSIWWIWGITALIWFINLAF